MKKNLVAILEQAKRSTITLSDLEKVAGPQNTYDDFAANVRILMDEGFLTAVKSHGVNWCGLPNRFRIQKGKVKQPLIEEIQEMQFKVHPAMDLRPYFSAAKKKWSEDQPWIWKLNEYLQRNGLPTTYTNSSERSYELMKDEKWIDEKGGKSILEKINLFDKLKIMKTPDPLMFALNPTQLLSKHGVHRHLVVENKATYTGLLDKLRDTDFTTLIYGSGWKIASSLNQLTKQLGLTNKDIQHDIYYFGDLDYEGISIFHHLHEKYDVKLATDFYEAIIRKPFYKGKENQTRNDAAVQHFLQYFNEEDQEKIASMFKENGYYPQEALAKEELHTIWRKALWTHN
ncbi:Wadjet anti-phage system protein JetD domain-containing protein [Robertmurraya massiliosenegalensis]|uniref:Wadjet anti-phage system protein JetD domain-containing protein n=1 Tax=Robertmurraya massiliosenegalensis TaxID=1287657 RepID=UPI00030C1341|nr:Wadjet anti-phage system protein JetD domain-containing protein [Robertmurraya massiliosenegalensis]